MKRLIVATCLIIAGIGGLGITSHGAALAATGGQSDAAHACQQSGYLTLQGTDGTTFKNEGQCVGYAARGGTIQGVSACTMTSTTGCLTFNNATLPSSDGTGHTITLTGSTSFVDTCTSGLCIFSPQNNLATGGGTYVEKDSTGRIVSSGAYRIAATANSGEGLLALVYEDLTTNLVSTCAAAAAGLQVIDVQATLIDGSTGAAHTAIISGETGGLNSSTPLPVGIVGTPTDDFFGGLSSSALTTTC